MIELDVNNINKHKNNLIKFEGFIPFNLFGYIDMLKRNNYLKSIGKFDDIAKENMMYRNKMKSSDDADMYMDNILLKWVEDNPQFNDILIFD